jgi:hypothetical protein
MKRVSLMLLSFGLMYSCSSRQPAATQQSVISGKISGYGNRAPALARVDLYEPDSSAPKRFQAARDGSFSVTTPSTGAIRLTFTGALHDSYSTPLLLRKPSQVKLDARLEPYPWQDKIEEVKVIGDFNKFSRDISFAIMVKEPDGTYAAELGNLAGDKLGYQLVGLVKGSERPVPGTQYDDMVFDSRGSYVSRLAVRNGTVRIVFDPASLPRGAAAAGVTFIDSGSEVARIAALEAAMRARQQEFFDASARFRSSGKDTKDFHYDWSRSVAGLRKQLDSEEDATIRQMLFISLLDLKRFEAEEIDAETAKQALAAIPPDSLLWEVVPSLLFDSIKLAGGLGPYGGYLQAVVTAHPSRQLRALTLEQAYGDAMSVQDLARAKDYYRRLTTEFGDLAPGQRVKSRPPEAGR